MGKWWATLVAAAFAGFTAIAPQIQQTVSAHPTASMVLSMAFATLAHLVPSPVAPTK